MGCSLDANEWPLIITERLSAQARVTFDSCIDARRMRRGDEEKLRERVRERERHAPSENVKTVWNALMRKLVVIGKACSANTQIVRMQCTNGERVCCKLQRRKI